MKHWLAYLILACSALSACGDDQAKTICPVALHCFDRPYHDEATCEKEVQIVLSDSQLRDCADCIEDEDLGASCRKVDACSEACRGVNGFD